MPTRCCTGIRSARLWSLIAWRQRAAVFEWAALIAAQLLSGYLAWYAVRRGCQHITQRRIAPRQTPLPLWIPQLCMAIGCVVAFVLAFLDAIVARLGGREWFIAAPLRWLSNRRTSWT